MRGIVVVIAVMTVGGCAQPGSVECADGTLCPAGSVCDDNPWDRCLFPDQLGVCGDEDERCATPSVPNGVCRTGVCHVPVCGDGIKDPDEECDYVLPVPEDADECTDLQWYEGDAVACTMECELDQSGCSGRCGDGLRNGPEWCEGTDLPSGQDCITLGNDRGSVSCTDGCAADESACGPLGWTVAHQVIGRSYRDVWTSSTGAVYAIANFGKASVYDGTTWHDTPTGTTQPLQSVSGIADDLVIAVGGGGAIIRYDPPNRQWVAMASPTTELLTDVHVVTASDAYAVGLGGTLLHYDGTSWTAQDPETTTNLMAVWVAPSGELWVAGSGLIGFRSSGNWRSLDAGSFGSVFVSIWGTHQTNVWIGTSLGSAVRWNGNLARDISVSGGSARLWGIDGVVLSAGSKGGMTFLAPPMNFVEHKLGLTDTVEGIHGQSSADLWAVTDRGSILHSTGRGFWLRWPEQTVLDRNDVVVRYPNSVTFVGTEGVFDHHHTGWIPYTITQNAGAMTFHAVTATSDGIFAVGSGGAVTRDYGGSVLLTEDSGIISTLHGVWASPSGTVYAVGLSGRLVRRTEGVWEIMNTNTNESLHGIWGTSDTDVYAVGATGLVLHFDGTEWKPQFSRTTSDLLAVSGAGGRVVAVGVGGIILHRDNGEWNPAPSPTTSDLLTVKMFAADDGIAAGNAGAVLEFEGNRWARLRAPDATAIFRGMAGTRNDIVFATNKVPGFRLLRTAHGDCAASETTCTNHWDEDCDGLVDCSDPDCASDAACETTELSCTDGLDNDGDGHPDCYDSNCTGATSENCSDRYDNDCDGLIDCQDSECASTPYCTGVCLYAGVLECGVEVWATSLSVASRINSYDFCGGIPAPNPEFSFRFTAPVSGVVNIGLVVDKGTFNMFVLDADGGDCDIRSCIGYAVPIDDQEMSFTATAGQTYYVVVEDAVAQSGAYWVYADCP